MDKVPTNKRGLVTSQDVSLDKEYIEWIHELKSRFRNSQIKAAVKVNSEQLLFNWQLGRDLVVRKAEEKWGTGIVNQVSLDLQAEFPEAKGFSARNLWFMKQWYSFYSVSSDTRVLISNLEGQINTHGSKLNQLGSEICEKILNQPDSEMIFPSFFAFVPWKHHVMIVQKAKSVEEALFYIRKTIEGNLSRSALDDCIRADLYHTSGAAVNEFVKRDSDNPSIGLLICKDMDRTEVQLAFQGITTPMGVAKYDNV